MRARVNGVELFFDVHGSGLRPAGEALADKPAVIVLHGGPGLDHTSLVEWLAPLTDALQLIYVDHRGHGRSARPPLETCTLEAMADDVEALRVHLGLTDVTLLGVSFGGMVALTHAVRHPGGAARLVLCATAPSGEFVEAAWRRATERATPEQMVEVAHVLRGTLRDDADLREAMRVLAPLYQHAPVDEPGPADRAIVHAAMLNRFFGVDAARYDVRDRLPGIRVPALVLTGRHDWICPPSQSAVLVDGLADVRQVLFERSGHRLHREENAKFTRVVREFVLDAARDVALAAGARRAR